MAIAILIPVVFFSVLVLKLLIAEEKEAAVKSMNELGRASILTADQELTAALAISRTLATSGSLANGEFAAFYDQAKRANAVGEFNTALIDETGQQIFNTVLPFEARIPSPRAENRQRVVGVLEKNSPQISNLIRGSSTGQYVIAVETPVKIKDGRRFVIAQWIYAERLSRLLPKQDVPSDWLLALYDKQGTIIARSYRPEEMVGTMPVKALHELLMKSGEARFSVPSREGKPMYGTITRSSFSGWSAAVGVPLEEFNSAAHRAVAVAAIGFVLAVIFALTAALIFSRRLVRAIDSAALSAQTLVQHRIPPILDSKVAEVNKLHQSLNEVGKVLHATEEAREHHLKEALEARAMAEAENKSKDEFLAMLAHELRNPLAPISAAADLLAFATLDHQAVRQTSEIISRQVRHMAELVDDLLDVSRVTRGLIELEKTEIDIKHVVSEALEQMRPLAENKQHSLIIEVEDEPVYVLGDHKRLVQILTNLLNNAVKYTPHCGNIQLRMQTNAENVELTVMDNGIGISADLQPRIFDLFTQAERTSDRSQGGLGIGLALVKSLVDLHCGTVSCTSDGTGRGSRFTVMLPRLLDLKPAEHGSSTAGINLTSVKKHSILVVDDNVDAANMLAMYLQNAGHTVIVEHKARIALERARIDRPDVCLIDIGLPEMDGNELAKCLRNLPETAHCLLIAVSGYGADQDKQKSLAAGFADHLVKPVDATKLKYMLQLH